MMDGPVIPMTLAECLGEIEPLRDLCTPRQLRAIEVLSRLARRGKASSTSGANEVALLVDARAHLRAADTALEAAISTATTGGGIEAKR